MYLEENEKKLVMVIMALGDQIDRLEFDRNLAKRRIEELENELKKAKERVADLEAKERGEWN